MNDNLTDQLHDLENEFYMESQVLGYAPSREFAEKMLKLASQLNERKEELEEDVKDLKRFAETVGVALNLLRQE